MEEAGNGSNESCSYYNPTNQWLMERFVLVAMIGSTVSIVCLVENLLLFYVFARKAQHWSSHHLFLLFLSVIDIFMAVSYICLMSTQVLMDFFVSVQLLRLWHAIVLPMLTLSHSAMAASSYLILAATWERYLITVNSSLLRWAQRNRPTIAVSAVLLGIVLKGGVYLELNVKYVAYCAGTMSEYQLTMAGIANNFMYHYWSFYCRQIFTVFIPFVLLSLVNAGIVLRLRQKRIKRQANLQQHNAFEVTLQRKRHCDTTAVVIAMKKDFDIIRISANVRSATRMLVLVVMTYLIANAPNVVISIWEYVNVQELMTTFLVVYTFSVDTVSLLTIVAGALRLPIYCWCSEHLRNEIKQLSRSIRHRGGGGSSAMQLTTGVTATDDDEECEDDDEEKNDQPTTLSDENGGGTPLTPLGWSPNRRWHCGDSHMRTNIGDKYYDHDDNLEALHPVNGNLYDPRLRVTSL